MWLLPRLAMTLAGYVGLLQMNFYALVDPTAEPRCRSSGRSQFLLASALLNTLLRSYAAPQ